jgi:hypothetical protein
MRYKRSSPISRHFLSPKFWPFETKPEFFNTNSRLHKLALLLRFFGVNECNRDVTPIDRGFKPSRLLTISPEYESWREFSNTTDNIASMR